MANNDIRQNMVHKILHRKLSNAYTTVSHQTEIGFARCSLFGPFDSIDPKVFNGIELHMPAFNCSMKSYNNSNISLIEDI